jgi:hypothetical protein
MFATKPKKFMQYNRVGTFSLSFLRMERRCSGGHGSCHGGGRPMKGYTLIVIVYIARRRFLAQELVEHTTGRHRNAFTSWIAHNVAGVPGAAALTVGGHCKGTLPVGEDHREGEECAHDCKHRCGQDDGMQSPSSP